MRMMQTQLRHQCTKRGHKRLDDANDANDANDADPTQPTTHQEAAQDVNVAQLAKRAPKRLDDANDADPTQPSRGTIGCTRGWMMRMMQTRGCTRDWVM